MSKLLLDEHPLLVLPSLAKTIGLNEAIIIQQIHYWLQDSKHFIDGKKWTYNSIRAWEIQFPFWSTNTIRRAIESLVKNGLIFTGNFNKHRRDRTIWYSVSYENLNKLDEQMHIPKLGECNHPERANGFAQDERMDLPNMGEPLPETSSETHSKTSSEIIPTSPTGSVKSDGVLFLDFIYEHHKGGILPADIKRLYSKASRSQAEEIVKLDGLAGAQAVLTWGWADKFWGGQILFPAVYSKVRAVCEKMHGAQNDNMAGVNDWLKKMKAEGHQ